MAKKKRTPAQERATRKLIAFNKARKKAKSGTAEPRVSRAKTGSARKAHTRKARASNPAPAIKRRRRTAKRAASAAGRTLRYRRKNPVGGVGGFIKDTLVPSAIGGAGALALDVMMGVLPLPPTLKAGPLRPVVRVVGSIALGMAAKMVTTRARAEQITAGALTVTLYDVAKAGLIKVAGGKIPGLSEYVGEELPVAGYVDEYVGEDQPMIGYTDAGMQVGDLMPDGSVEGYETGVYR